MATLRLYIDEDPHQDLSLTLGALGHDTLASKNVGTKGFSDARQFDYALVQGRVLISCNARDYFLLHEALVLWSRRESEAPRPPHLGILIVPNGNQLNLTGATRIIDEFVRSPAADHIAGKLFEWTAAEGWSERIIL